MQDTEFIDALNRFVRAFQELFNEYFAERFSILKVPKIQVKNIGPAMARIESVDEGQRPIVAFVATKDNKTKELGEVKRGDVMKPADKYKPARIRRGNIFSDQGGREAFDTKIFPGIRYLR